MVHLCIYIQALVEELCGAVQIHLDTFRQYNQFYAAQYELDKLFGMLPMADLSLVLKDT